MSCWASGPPPTHLWLSLCGPGLSGLLLPDALLFQKHGVWSERGGFGEGVGYGLGLGLGLVLGLGLGLGYGLGLV